MYNRYLFVGLGGSGGKTLRFLKDQMKQWMQSHGMPAQLPGAWRFLHIDTPQSPDGQGIDDLVAPLAPSEYLGLAGHNSTYYAIQKELDNKPSVAPELATWRVEPASVQVPLARGAGQYRAIGSTIALAYADRIRSVITDNLNALKQVSSMNDLAECFRRAHRSPTASVQNVSTYAVVVSSLSGGSGAGLLHTVCDVLASEGEAGAEQPMAILFTPEVFRTLNAAQRHGVQANALAAICELLNGYWWGGDVSDPKGEMHPPPLRDAVLKAAGCSTDLQRSGAFFPFLVGMQNAAGVSYSNHDQLFEMVGRAMSSWVVDIKVNEQFVAHTTGNWQSAAQAGGAVLADIANGAPTHEIDHPPVSGLGFTRLDVGMSYFANYAAERLMRAVYDHLVSYHHKSEMARQAQAALKHSDPQAVIDYLVQDRMPFFLGTAKLAGLLGDDGEAPAEHPMVNAVAPPAPVEAFCDKIDELLPRDMREKPTWWNEHIVREVESLLPSERADFAVKLDVAAERWAEGIQESVLDAVNREMGRSGLLVSARCCEQAAERLHAISSKLAEASSDLDHWATRWKAELEPWPAHADDKMSAEDASVADRVDSIVGAGWGWRADHMRLAKTSEMLREAAERLLLPAAESIRQAHKSAEREGSAYPNWADNQTATDSPPLSVGPPTGTLTLLDPQNYKLYFEHLLASTFTGEQGEPLEQARQSIMDTDLAQAEPGGNWWPSGLQSAARQPKSLSMHAGVKRLEMKAATRDWLRRAGSPFGDFLNISLRSMFAGESQRSADVRALLDQDEIESRFKDRMNEALRSAAPLVNVDDAMFGLVHPGVQKSNRLACSAIPLDGLPIKEPIAEILRSHQIDDGVIDGNFDADDSTCHIDITACFEAPRSVLTVRSLFKPIADDWEANMAQGKQTAFWSRRRARPLARFVPAPYALLLAMIRGWLIGALLGQIERGSPPRIARPDRREPAVFPERFSQQAPESLDWMATALETLALAYVQASRQGSLAPLDAYLRLRDLGTAGSSVPFSYYSYRNFGPEMSAWIDHGAIHPDPIGEVRVDQSLVVPEERAQHVADTLVQAITAYDQNYKDLQTEWRGRPAMLSQAPLWAGAWPEIRRALVQIKEAAERHHQRAAVSDVLH